MFNNLITKEFKALFTEAIDTILADSGLTVPCVVEYKYGNQNLVLCHNCVYDPISMRSINTYNGTGPVPFTADTICPVCQGNGNIENIKKETLYLAVLFDTKYWLNWNSKSINIKDGNIQTLCDIKLLPKLKNAEYLTIDTNQYAMHRYARAGDPEPCGFGNNKYITTMWERA